jgi:hypothetical protein
MIIANYLKNCNQSIVHVSEASRDYWHGWVDKRYVSRILTISKDSLCCCLSPLSKKKWQWSLAQLHPTQFCHSLQQHPCQMQPLSADTRPQLCLPTDPNASRNCIFHVNTLTFFSSPWTRKQIGNPGNRTRQSYLLYSKYEQICVSWD